MLPLERESAPFGSWITGSAPVSGRSNPWLTQFDAEPAIGLSCNFQGRAGKGFVRGVRHFIGIAQLTANRKSSHATAALRRSIRIGDLEKDAFEQFQTITNSYGFMKSMEQPAQQKTSGR